MYGTLFCLYHNCKAAFLLLLLVGNYFTAMYTCICANVQNRLDKYINSYSRKVNYHIILSEHILTEVYIYYFRRCRIYYNDVTLNVVIAPFLTSNVI